MYTIKATAQFAKLARKLDSKVKERLKKKLISIQQNPDVDFKYIKNTKSKKLRYRMGSYRITCEIDHKEKIIYVLTIYKRDQAYKK